MSDDISFLKTVKYAATAGMVLLVAGILTVMVLARGRTGDDGDIVGVVAPALFPHGRVWRGGGPRGYSSEPCAAARGAAIALRRVSLVWKGAEAERGVYVARRFIE